MLFRFRRFAKTSYSQSGEDLIVRFVMKALGVAGPISYLDIGAHHPAKMNNTYAFYLQGHRGVCIEPNPVFFREIKRHRRRDVCLNVGVGPETQDRCEFYVLTHSRLSTFSKDEAERVCALGKDRIEDVITLPVIGINDVMARHLSHGPQFVSIDVEGMDEAIISAFDFRRWRPEVFCVETAHYRRGGSEVKNQAIVDMMLGNAYMVYADTYNNTIFVDETQWLAR